MPQEVKKVVEEIAGKNYEFIKIHSEVVVDTIDHSFMMVPDYDKMAKTKAFLSHNPDIKVVIFTQMKVDAAAVADLLVGHGYKA